MKVHNIDGIKIVIDDDDKSIFYLPEQMTGAGFKKWKETNKKKLNKIFPKDDD